MSCDESSATPRQSADVVIVINGQYCTVNAVLSEGGILKKSRIGRCPKRSGIEMHAKFDLDNVQILSYVPLPRDQTCILPSNGNVRRNGKHEMSLTRGTSRSVLVPRTHPVGYRSSVPWLPEVEQRYSSPRFTI